MSGVRVVKVPPGLAKGELPHPDKSVGREIHSDVTHYELRQRDLTASWALS